MYLIWIIVTTPLMCHFSLQSNCSVLMMCQHAVSPFRWLTGLIYVFVMIPNFGDAADVLACGLFPKRIQLMCTSVYEQVHILGIALVHHNWTGLSSLALAAFEYAFPHRGRSKAPLTDLKRRQYKCVCVCVCVSCDPVCVGVCLWIVIIKRNIWGNTDIGLHVSVYHFFSVCISPYLI